MSRLHELIWSLMDFDPELKGVIKGGLVPDYLQPGYRRATAADEIAERYSSDPQALGALLNSALTDPERLVRDRCIRGLIDSKCESLDAMLVAFLFDSDEEIRLLALEALAVSQTAVAQRVAEWLQSDSDQYVAELAQKLLNGEKWLRYLI